MFIGVETDSRQRMGGMLRVPNRAVVRLTLDEDELQLGELAVCWLAAT